MTSTTISASVPSGPPTCQNNCKQCILLFLNKAQEQPLAVGCCATCHYRRDPWLEHSKGDFLKHEDIVRVYGGWDEYVKAPWDLITFWCDLDFRPPRASPEVVVHRRKFPYPHQPCYPDGKPCPFWRCNYTKNPYTGEAFELW